MGFKGTPDKLAELEAMAADVRGVNPAAFTPQSTRAPETTPGPSEGEISDSGASWRKQTDMADVLADQCRLVGLTLVRDARLVPGRKWMWDLWFPGSRVCGRELAVEVHGGLHAIQAHSTAKGVERDLLKRNALALLGTHVQLDFTANHVRIGYALRVIEAVLKGEKPT